MIAVIAGPDAPWLTPLRQRIGPHRVFQPPGLGRLTARLPAAKRIPLQLAHRRLLGRMAALWLPRDTTAVMAPALAASEVFSLASRRGLPTTLIEDLVDLGGLHADLDAAAQRHPHRAFLGNYRAPNRWVQRQDAERRAATSVRVQGCFARDRRGGQPLYPPEPQPPSRAWSGRFTARLAGPAMGRSGLFEALEALRNIPSMTLQIRVIDATPPDVLRHPRVRNAGPEDSDVVLAPSWVEAYAPEVRVAASTGIPIVGTRRGMGWATGAVHEPGDAERLTRLLQPIVDSPEEIAGSGVPTRCEAMRRSR